MADREAVDLRSAPLAGVTWTPAPDIDGGFTAAVAGNRVEPLIEAEAAFVALERACLNARDTIHLCFRIIDPDFPLISDEARAAGHERWIDLLAGRAKAGVSVRILTADFDPVMATGMHRDARQRYLRFREEAEALADGDRGRFQVMCVLHPALVGAGAALAAWPATWKRIGQEIRALNDILAKRGRETAAAALACSRTLSRHIVYSPSRDAFVRRLRAPHRIRPATHHEKLAVIDSRACFVGGIDVCDDTYDTAGHDEDQAWHDVGYRIDGPAAGKAEIYFRQRWSDAVRDLADASSGIDEDFGKAPRMGNEQPDKDDAQTRIRLLRTRSVHRPGLFARTPKPDITEIRQAATELVGKAERFLYIENQFLRDLAFADAIAARGRAVPDLVLLAMLPVVEFRAMEKGRIDRAAAHGLALQHEALRRLGRAFSDRLGAFTLVHDEPEPGDDDLEKFRNGKIVYVHSKLVIADDARAIAGSANFNGRSFACDSELSFEWHDGDAIRAFRHRLWKQFLGDPAGLDGWKPADFLDRWREIARHNGACEPDARRGFAVPYRVHPKARGVRRHWLIPDDLV